ncbi:MULTISPECIES: Imm8 family immunity protein [unclassified Mesorhizobium]|uniref:Imm8 family immunity protein n=1 Tax=unclassified Mesorhizobium TaxID=325217 RepID=UPI00112E5D6A|nr:MULTISPECIES: Imm8 family immunity protein [unclassified Mesorhizobium]TPK91872.1 hypothetical protein FJ548_02270 [Mesorhizobium sp. B2-4-17]UCI32478.1 immunity 8 family protein [Mesorhizobium sp. B4-1-4]
MKAEYRGYRFTNSAILGEDPATWLPDDPADFLVEIDFYAGEAGKEGSDAFTATVCSTNRFLRSQTEKVFSGGGVIFMPRFDHVELESFLSERCAVEGETWNDIAFQLSRLGEWEFEYLLGNSN